MLDVVLADDPDGVLEELLDVLLDDLLEDLAVDVSFDPKVQSVPISVACASAQ